MNNMKNVENKITTIKLNDELVTYASLLKTVLNQPVKEGITISEMRSNLRIINTIEDALKYDDNVITFEDEDFVKVAKLVEESVWGINHIDIVNFCDHIVNLKQ